MVTPGVYNAPQQPFAAQVAQVPAEKLQQAAQAVINAYAQTVLKSLCTTVEAENAFCLTHRVEGKDVSTMLLGFADGSQKLVKLRESKLHVENADKEIDRKIAALSKDNQHIFDLLFNRFEGLLTSQARSTLILIQASVSGCNRREALEKMSLRESQVAKSYVYGGLLKITAQHKVIVLSGLPRANV